MKKILIAIGVVVVVGGFFLYSTLNDELLFCPITTEQSLNLELKVIATNELQDYVGEHNLPDEAQGQFIVIKAHPDQSIQNRRTTVVSVEVNNEIINIIPKGELLQDKDYFGILKLDTRNFPQAGNFKFKLLDSYTK